MSEILCTHCGTVGEPKAGQCAHCGSTEVLPADSPPARKFIDERTATKGGGASGSRTALRAEATGKVLGRALGKLFRK
jgi:predicted ATP-dependent serine protease